MQSEIDLLRRQIVTLQTELVYKEQIQKMQSEIDSFKVQINKITSKNNEDYILDDTNQQLSPIYPDYIQFIINYILPWAENKIDQVSTMNLILGKKFAQIDINRIQVRIGGGKREWQYVLDRFKIMNKIHELFDNEAK
ncbi:hypothetical protein Glove_522g9 [Diversispora epigaea]|uniref:Uncharacterized protein n=1 Tax=Diversispora epigaea TaxID=1348612 RepID=A0A397GI15_9GLOM|nr:hypothetical protein Glove_522g9 [Diversispora epigaea]